ncbi:MAG: HNH endonuclease [Clostridia bacterium]|nr:HNH endonuclease [Clostridia bacterium]
MKLEIELVPDGCWYSNLRSALPPKLWDVIRKDAYARAGGKCTVCGKRGRLEAHERWSYDEEKHLQKLETVVALCHDCHSVVHIGRTQLTGDGDKAMEHFMKVNGCTQIEFHKALREANLVHQRRNKIDDWVTDISYIRKFQEKVRE